jgi:hypothetical protein
MQSHNTNINSTLDIQYRPLSIQIHLNSIIIWDIQNMTDTTCSPHIHFTHKNSIMLCRNFLYRMYVHRDIIVYNRNVACSAQTIQREADIAYNDNH